MVRPHEPTRAASAPIGHAAELFTEVKRTRSSDDVVAQIRNAVVSGELKLGDRLPSERDLCVLFAVSRATLREGLRTLEALGAIEIRPGAAGGIFVSEPQGDQVGAALEALLHFRRATVRELGEFRTSFEGETARWAAERAAPEDVERLEEIATRFTTLADEDDLPWRVLVEVDLDFHLAMALCSKNQVRVAIMLGIHRALHRASSSLAEDMSPPARREIGQDLTAIAAAVRAHDPRLAARRMSRHVKKYSDLEQEVQERHG
jgi:GntR family transcriptional repressor for pyruvate dehydrogenase complex